MTTRFVLAGSEEESLHLTVWYPTIEEARKKLPHMNIIGHYKIYKVRMTTEEVE